MIDRKKLKKYLEFKKNPYLMLYKMLQDINKIIDGKVLEKVNEMIGKMKKEVVGSVRKNVKDLYETVFQRLLLNKKKFKGDKGEKGDSIKGDKGNKGERGPVGPVGSAKDGKDGKDGEDGKYGKTPVKGIDYFTKQDIFEVVQKLSDLIDKPFEDIKKEIREIRDDIIFIKTSPLGGRRRTLHRGGSSYAMSDLLGTGDDLTVEFTLKDTPYDNDALPFLFVGGGVRFKTDDWTRSNKIITFNHAPPDGAKVRAPIYRKK